MINLTEERQKYVDTLWNKITAKMRTVSEDNRDKIPYIEENGKWCDMAKTDITWWTNGFWAGINWLLYIGTNDETYRAAAEESERMLDGAFKVYDTLNHDVGFMWHISAGVNYRLFGGHSSKVRASLAADILASRYNPSGKFIRAWNDDNIGRVIIDSMMNIPLLYWATAAYDDPRFENIAVSHADTIMRTHIRPDGSARHIVDLDPITGDAINVWGGQGYDAVSAWSRGQAWALYGFTLSYIYTVRKEYLDTAKRVANYFIAAVCGDWLPRADFRAPESPVIYDSTAGACAACGLIELSQIVPDYESEMYLGAAFNLIRAMDERFCDWTDEHQAILGMGTEAYGRLKTTHVPIIYGDYFFIEAIYKLRNTGIMFW